MSVCLWVTSDDRDSACGFPLLETGDGDSFTCRRPHCDTQMHVFIDTNAHSLLHRCAKHALSCPWFPRREACQLPNTTQTHSKLFFFLFLPSTHIDLLNPRSLSSTFKHTDTLTHLLTHTKTHKDTHSLTHSFTHSLTPLLTPHNEQKEQLPESSLFKGIWGLAFLVLSSWSQQEEHVAVDSSGSKGLFFRCRCKLPQTTKDSKTLTCLFKRLKQSAEAGEAGAEEPSQHLWRGRKITPSQRKQQQQQQQ